ncbi:TetR/AcrR family transcriptional regulator [Cohnella sp. GCM10027633]|uniref:TetR/AcrR family transcriptional regulator n=1 Tax=unclassified Cohnella TaxID=2636738 RepID=UPI00362D7EB2
MARTKEFDEDAVLLKAMKLFWEKGYEKTSIMDLVSHMGIHKKSIYDTFGDKHSLYVKALQRYGRMLRERRQIYEAMPPVEAIRALLERTIRRDEGEKPLGCFVVNTAVELGLHDSECKSWVNEWAVDYERMIRDLIAKGQQAGEINRTLDADTMSCFIHNAMVGLRVKVKTIDDREKLQRVIDTTMAMLRP